MRSFGASSIVLALGLGFVVGASGAPAAAATFPHAEADTLDGAHVVFPDAAKGKPTILTIAVEQDASGNLREWTKRLTAAAGDRATVLAVVVADGAPFFVKGAIRNALRKDDPPVPAGAHSTTLLSWSGKGWKSAVGPGAKAEPEVVVIDGSGEVAFAKRFAPSDEGVAEVVRALPPAKP